VGRFARPDEVAAAVLYLASGVAEMITGENLYLDGGYSVP
jgi:2-deoxy-D-gluconate 3-dehydrogenase